MNRRDLWSLLVAAAGVVAVVAVLLVQHSAEADPEPRGPHVVNLHHPCGRKGPDVTVTLPPGQKSVLYSWRKRVK